MPWRRRESGVGAAPGARLEDLVAQPHDFRLAQPLGIVAQLPHFGGAQRFYPVPSPDRGAAGSHKSHRQYRFPELNSAFKRATFFRKASISARTAAASLVTASFDPAWAMMSR